MINIVFLDTNIYRNLGLNFYDHIDYKGLEDYCYSSASEIFVAETVYREYLDFYTKDVLQKRQSVITNTFEKLKKLEKYKDLTVPDFSNQYEKQLKFLEEKFQYLGRKVFPMHVIGENDLLEFLLDNKRQSKKDNTRDFLIWMTALSAASQYEDEQIILISEDKIFRENEVFKELASRWEVNNVRVFESIPSFLGEFGFKSEKLTSELIKKSIPVKVIDEQLKINKDAIPGYISDFYYHSRKEFKLEKFEIKDVYVESFYAHKNTDKNKIEVIAHVNVEALMIFEPEEDLEKLSEYMTELYASNELHFKPESFDPKGRPIFDDFMQFHFGMNFNEKTNKITHVKFFDFFPDHAQYIRMKAFKGIE